MMIFSVHSLLARIISAGANVSAEWVLFKTSQRPYQYICPAEVVHLILILYNHDRTYLVDQL